MFSKGLVLLIVCYVFHSNLKIKIKTQPEPEGAVGGASGSDSNAINAGFCEEQNIAPDEVAFTAQDQRAYIAVEAKLGTDLVYLKRKMKRVFKKNVYHDTQIGKLYNEFKNNQRLSTERCTGSGRPVTACDEANAAYLNELMRERRTWTIDQLQDRMGISYGSIRTLLMRGKYRKVHSVWLPHSLTEDDFQNRVKAARNNLRAFTRNPRMLGRIIAIDETWVRSYLPLEGQQAQEWRLPGEAPPQRVVAGIWDMKLMMICAVHQDQIVAWEYMPRGVTVNSERYVKFLNTTLRRYIEEKGVNQPIILQDNARPHNSDMTHEFILDEMGWELLDHPSYSPDLDPLDFDVFRKLKRPLRGKRYQTEEELKEAMDESINSANANQTLIGTTELVGRWQKVIDLKGQYLDH